MSNLLRELCKRRKGKWVLGGNWIQLWQLIGFNGGVRTILYQVTEQMDCGEITNNEVVPIMQSHTVNFIKKLF